MKSDFLIALTQLAAERHLPKEEVLKAIEVALASAFKRDHWGEGFDVAIKLNPNSGDIGAYALKTVVEEVEDPRREITLSEAEVIKTNVTIGDVLELEALPHQASRIAAQTAKQVVLQRLREAERDLIYDEFAERIGDIVSGVVGQIEGGRLVTLELERATAILPPEEQVTTERYRRGQRLKVFVLEVNRVPKGPEIVVSRSDKNLLKRLFELEVPEVYNGIVEIRSIAREAGSRSKVAVVAHQDGVDPVGSCIGMRGNRIQNIVNELQGEKIDVVRWDQDLKRFVSNALSPAEVVHVEANEEEKSGVVVVPERQLSLAIGREGQNARLAAKLTGWHLDIKSMAEWEAIKNQWTPESDETDTPELATKEDAPISDVLEEQTVATVATVEPDTKVVSTEEEVKETEEDIIAAPALEEALAEILAQEEAAVSLNPDEGDTGLISAEEIITMSLDAEEESEQDDSKAGEELSENVWETFQLTPDAGKIRFAEDIVDDFRGRENRGRKKSNRGARSSGGKSANTKRK